ncbi:transglycosylase SLT domain-containing protein [Streptomyces albulus]|nr:transglycosylase SLT domain-containing protein [Streptomyces noursei]
MASRGRAPVKVGAGYIEIFPELSKTGLARMRTDLTRQMTRAGERLADLFSRSMGQSFSDIASVAAKQAKVAGKAAEKEVLDTSNKLRQIERSLTRFHGEEAGQQFRVFRNLARQREQLEQGTSATTRRAINDVVQANRQAVQETIREERAKAQEKRRLEREAQLAVRQRLSEERLAIQTRTNALQNELRGLAAQRREYANTITTNQRQLRGFMTEHRGSTKSAAEQWKALSQGTETFGTNLEQVGRSITQNLVAPLALAAGYVTKIGTQSADMQFLSSRGLERAGFDNKQVMDGIRSIQDFAVKTPFSLEDMTDKFQQLTRNFQSYGDSTGVSLKKSEKLIRGIADFAASYGVLDPERVKGAMYSADMMMDMSKLNTRSLKQFSRGTGIPINELAKMAGFKTSGKGDEDTEAKEFLAKVQERGEGVSSKAFFANFLKAYDTRKGVKGTAESLGTGSIGGALQAVREQAQLSFGKQFGDFNPETGRFEWTELGQRVHSLVARLGKLLEDPGFQALTGGLLSQFVRALGLLLTGVEKTEGFLNDHPWLKDLVAKAVKVAAVLGPLAIAIGLATKIIGKVGKSFLPALKIAGGLAKGARGAVRTGNQFLSGATAGRGSFREAYRERRAESHGGDDRSMMRRGIDRMRGQDSRAEALQVNTEAAERALRAVDQKIQTVKAAIRSLNELRLNNLAESLGGETGTSVKAGARDADQRIGGVRRGVQQLNAAGLGEVTGKVRSFTEAAKAAERQVKQVLAVVHDLNGAKLGLARQQFGYLRDKADTAKRHVKDVTDEITKLNGRSLEQIRGRFGSGLTPAIKGSYKEATGLNGRIKDVNARGLSQVTGRVRTLTDALNKAGDKAERLDGSIKDIANNTGFGGGSGGGGKKRKKPKGLATGGVLPGYRPGVDSIPAILSPGEAVLRPEVTAALGAPMINHWNALARKGQLARYASGGIVGRFGIDKIIDLIHAQNVWPLATAGLNTMQFDGASDAVGGRAQEGMLHAGGKVGNWVGSGLASRFDFMYDFATKDSFKFLKRIPTAVGQAIGIIGGAFAPVLGEYFHDDVWKGSGNILERGNKFLSDTFSMKTLTRVFGDFFGGIWDSIKSIVGGAKDLITDPVGTITDTFSALWDIGSGEVNQVVDMVSATKEIVGSPLGYAEEVLSSVWATAKEALPNTDGLFDFSKGEKLTAKKPDFGSIAGGEEPPGQGVQRWKPTVQRVLKELGLAQSYTDLVLHRIGVESGGNPKAINLWDSNAKAGYPSQGLMQTIPQTFSAYAGPYRSLGITNGLASIYAGLNYAMHRYGSRWPQALSGNQGYWMGTISASPGLRMVGENGPELVNFRGGERVYSDRQTRDLLSTGKKYEIHIHEAKHEDTTQAVIRGLKYVETMYGM